MQRRAHRVREPAPPTTLRSAPPAPLLFATLFQTAVPAASWSNAFSVWVAREQRIHCPNLRAESENEIRRMKYGASNQHPRGITRMHRKFRVAQICVVGSAL